ncbi:MAG: ubiquitin-like domain-containing protein [Anaerolineales bacterium]
MTLARIRWIAASAALLVALFGFLSLTRTVTIVADGRSFSILTRAITVSGALREAGVNVGAKDSVAPGPGTWILGDSSVEVLRAPRLQMTADGMLYQTETLERSLPILLAQWKLTLEPGDRILLDGRTITLEEQIPEGPFHALKLRRAVQISLNDGEETVEFVSSAPTLGEALAGHGIRLMAGDRLEPRPETALTGPLSVSLRRAVQIHIAVGGAEMELFSSAETVGEALAQAGLALQGLDYSEPAADEPLPLGGEISVVRVNESLQVTQEIVPDETEWRPDDEAELDTISVIQEGKDGVSASRTRLRYENDEEVSRTQESERFLVEPQKQVNGYGTKIFLKTAVVDGITIEYYRAVTVFTTWYSPCNSGTSSCLNGTSSGLPVQQGTIATYLNWYLELKFATVYIPGYGMATFGDNSGANSNGREPWIDLAFSEAEVAAAGGQPWVNATVTIYFTTPVPAYVPPIWPPG